MFGPGRAIQTLPAGAVHVGMSTISVALSRRLAGAHQEKEQHYVAAPVFGRPDAAAAAKLFIVVAGPAKQIERCQVLFDATGQKTFVVGEDAPSANVIKLTGNFLIVGPMTAAVLPISLLIAFTMYRRQRAVFRLLGLRVRRNIVGFVLYVLAYQLVMSPISVSGYATELVRARRVW